ncbi:MAG TPA: Ig-like domain-containing protein, partial [Bryobacteraceae bacterium]
MNSRLIISLILTVAAALGQSSLGSGVISILPTDGATGVPLNARIIVTLSYSEGYSPAAFTLTQAGAAVPGTLKVPDFTLPFQFGGPAGSPGYLVFVPAQQLLPSTQYRIEVDPPVINGVPNRPPVYASFTTGSTTDTTPLQLVSSTPTSGDAGVSPLANLLLKFNKPIDPHSTLQNPFALVAVASGSIPYPYPQAQISLDGTAVTLIGSSMTLGNAYMIQTSASTLTDWLGNPLGSLPAPIVFNTVPNPPANGPIAKAILPLNGDSNVPLNSAIVVIFDRPLAQLDDTAGISVTAGAEPPTAIAIDTTLAGGTVLTIRPQTLLPANSVVSVHIAGLRDIFGTLAAPLTLGFQTGASPETRVLAMSGPLANPVPRNGSITAVFNRPVNPVLLGLGGVTVNGVSQPWSLSKDWLTLTISPGQPFPAGVYGGQVWVPFDLIQGKLNPFPLSFSTTGSIDLTAPSVVAISPPDGTSDAPTNAVIDVAFSKPVQLIAGAPPSLILLESGTPVAGKFGLSTTSGRFVPSAPLDPSASYQIQISGIADLGGNALPAFSSSFQTSAATNPSTPFQVVSRSPASFATNVDPQTPITVTFNRDVDPVGLYQVFSGFLVSSGKMISGSFQVTGPVVTLTPAEPLTPGATYAAEPYGIADLAGQQVQEQATTFTVAAGGPSVDTTSPVVTSVSPGDAQPVLYSNPLVIFTFSKPIAITTVTAQNFRAYTAQKGNLNVTVNALSSTQVSLTFAADPGSAVTLYVNPGVTDLSGNPLVPFRSTVITTRPSTGPAALLGQRPSAQAGMIPPNSAISLYFSAPLDHASVERGLVVSANGAIVSGAISWIADSTALTFTPSSPLPWGAVVQWVLTWPAQDQAGNALSLLANGSNFLTVSPAPPANITVLGTNLQFPGPQPIDTIIELSFSAPVPDSFLNAGTATIMPESAYGQPAGAATPCIPSRVGPARIRFTPPSAVLTPNSYYTFAFDSGTGVKWFSSFNVSAAVTPPNPSVVAQGPSGNNVPLNAAVTLVFSGPAIMLNTPGGLTLSSGGVAIPATYAWSTTGYAVTLTPAGLLQPNTDYTVVASGFEDNAGHAIPDVSWNFHTGVALDLVPPTILRIAPSGDGVSPNAQISVSFSKPVSGNWIERFSVAGSAAPGLQSTPVAGTVRFSSDQQTLYFTPSSPFASGHTYTVQVPLIQDFEGNNQAAGASNNYFTTGSFRVGFAPQGPPQVTLTNPANGATGVPINAQMQVQFDQPVTSDSLDGVVLYENGTVVAASARLEADGRTVTAIPANLPSAGSSYLMVANGIRNTSGVSMSGASQVAFTMGSTLDFTAPSFRSSPSDSQVDVPTNATVRVRFNEPLNALTAQSVLLSRSSL